LLEDAKDLCEEFVKNSLKSKEEVKEGDTDQKDMKNVNKPIPPLFDKQ
jgi:hypothetical protein